MRYRHCLRWPAVLALLGPVALTAGCGSDQKNLAEQQSNMKPLATLYGRFLGQHRGQPPSDEAQFKQFVRSDEARDVLESFQVNDAETLFVSSRDDRPYTILYGPTALQGPAGPGGSPVVIYEQEGVDGSRFVASSMGAVEEVDEARFAELVPGGS